MRLKPRVDAYGVEGVAAEREESELVTRLELRQADGAVGGDGRGRPAGDGGVGEEREGGCVVGADSASRDSTRLGRC